MFDAYIFDIDGTLTSTNKLIFASFNRVAKEYLDKSYSDEEIIKCFGPTEDALLMDWLGEKYNEGRRIFYHYYAANHNTMVNVFPHMLDVIKYLKEKDLPLGVCTGKGKDTTRITLEKIEADELFDMIVTGDDVSEPKPSPEGIKMFLDKYKLNPEKVLMVGDAPADLNAAKSAGVKIASVLWDSYAIEEIEKLGADYKFYSPEEFRNFIMQ